MSSEPGSRTKDLQLNQVDQYGEDGAGTKKGFAVYATTDIPAGATFPMVYGELVPIPNGKQVSLTNICSKSNSPPPIKIYHKSRILNQVVGIKRFLWWEKKTQ